MGIDARSAGRTLALGSRHMADGRACRWGRAIFYTTKVPARALHEAQKGGWCKSTRCASKGPMRHWLPRSLGAAHPHDVSIGGTSLRRAFGNVSTICISPPHSGQVGCQVSSGSVTDTAGSSGAVVAVTASWVTGTTCCCGAVGSSWRMRASLACRVPLARKP